MALLTTKGSSFSIGVWSKRKLVMTAESRNYGMVAIKLDYRARGKTAHLELVLGKSDVEQLESAIRGASASS